MKIGYYSQFFDPEVGAAAKRCYDHALIWAKEGLSVQVWTSFPNFPSGKLFNGYKTKLATIDNKYNREGISVIRNYSIIRPNSSPTNRALLYLSFSGLVLLNSIRHSRHIKSTDIIIGTSGIIFSALFILLKLSL